MYLHQCALLDRSLRFYPSFPPHFLISPSQAEHIMWTTREIDVLIQTSSPLSREDCPVPMATSLRDPRNNEMIIPIETQPLQRRWPYPSVSVIRNANHGQFIYCTPQSWSDSSWPDIIRTTPATPAMSGCMQSITCFSAVSSRLVLLVRRLHRVPGEGGGEAAWFK